MSSTPVSSEHDALLRAVARAPRAADALAQVSLTGPLREQLGDRAYAGEPALGSVVDGRYRIEARIGAGGMGVVFAAVHTQTHRRVALKWMREDALVRSERERTATRLRFAREARIAASIRHPNVVDVYDASREGEHPYLVMELLEGETLGAQLRRARLDWDALMALLLPALEGVAALHRRGVVHRDLKPDNVFIERAPQGALAKVLDFGVATLHASEADEESLTREGGIVGTPGYMPLEQLRGARDLDARTDVYALGVIAYEALTGQRPFRAANAAEHAALIASSAPRELGELLPSLRGARARAVMKALAREPRDRHASVEAFAHALRTARAGRPQLRVGAVLLALCVLLASPPPVVPASHPPVVPVSAPPTHASAPARFEPPASAAARFEPPASAPARSEPVLGAPSDEAVPLVAPPTKPRRPAPVRRTATELRRDDFAPRAKPEAVDPATRLMREDFE